MQIVDDDRLQQMLGKNFKTVFAHMTGDMDVAKLNREARKPPLFNKGFWSLF